MDVWMGVSITERINILEKLIREYGAILDDWVFRNLQAKGALHNPYAAGVEWVGGPVPILRSLQGLRRSLIDIQKGGVPRFPGPVSERPNGQVVARIYPSSLYERIVTPGVTAEVWMETGVSMEDLPETQALIYRHPRSSGRVVLVLGGGNVAALPVNDSMYKLFVENHVVLLKMSPVNEYLGPLIDHSFRELTESGFLQIVYGGVEEGKYLCQHPGIDEMHMTGSDKTYEAIVFGPGEEGTRRKRDNQPLFTKRFTAELGCVGPAIVVPGPWRSSDFDYQAEQIASHLCDNASFSCSRARVIVNHANWSMRNQFLQRIRTVLADVPLRTAYYPGAHEQYDRFLAAHPEAHAFGNPEEGQIPWTLVADIDPNEKGDICFTTESFCPVIAETAIEAESIPSFIDGAVSLANHDMWGTLSGTIIVHPKSLEDPAVSEAVDRAIMNLRHGIVAVNGIPGMAWVMASPPWGSFPGNEMGDIQSGTGFVHNTLMFSRPEKVVVRAPFKMWPKPLWFNSRARAYQEVARKVALYDLNPSWWKIPGIVVAALRT
jgi:acyl-CoA reductase-like NAD-dependent aldehyde dehydrogenase